MEKDFFGLYGRHALLALEVGHNSIADWNVIVYDRRRSPKVGDFGEPIIHCSGCHRELVFAQAYAMLAEYFNENMGGY